LDSHPLLRRLFAALEERGVPWVLLRAPLDFARPTGDVDLLVAPQAVDRFTQAAEASGFVALPGWESPPGLILVSYDRASDHWLVLDVATAVTFRSPWPWELPGAAETVLARRRVSDQVALPAEDDSFWLLVAHCLLDDGGVPARYRPRLGELARAGDGDDELGAALVAAAGGRIQPQTLRDAARAGDWAALERAGANLIAGVRAGTAPVEHRRAAVRAARRLARKPLLLPRRRGLSVALLGPNGVGKSTVAAGLERGFPLGARTVHMGLWKAAAANPRRLPIEILLRPLRLWARSAAAHYHQARGRLVIYDRYVYEARLPAQPPLVAAKRLYHRLLEHAVPRPDVAVVLDVPGEVAFTRKQENPPEELESERRVYAEIAAREPRVTMIDASQGVDAVRAEVAEIVWDRLAARWRRDHSGCTPGAG
jgi:hypothetical protein